MMIKLQRVSLAVSLLFLLGLVSPLNAQDAERQETTFFLTFVPNIQFAPVYIADARGYFAEAGYDVTIEYGDEPDSVNLIAAGQRDFGMVGGEQVILARQNDRPVVFVYEWFQQYPVGIVTPSDSGITTAADLAGRRVGVPGRFGATYSGLVALLNAADLTENDVDLREIGFSAPEVICVGGVEASAVYINNEPLQIQQLAQSGECGEVTGVNVLPVVEFADLVSNGIVTNEDLIANQPEQVAAMVAAFDAGLNDVLNDPFGAYLESASYIETLPLSPEMETVLQEASRQQQDYLATDPTPEDSRASREALYARVAAEIPAGERLQLDVLMASLPLWEAEVLGLTEAASWEVTRDTLLTMGFLAPDADVDLSAAYTNAFVPGAEE